MKNVILAIFIISEIGLLAVGLSLTTKYGRETKLVHNQLIAWQQKDQDIKLLEDNYLKNQADINVIDQALPKEAEVIGFFEKLEESASQSGLILSMDMTGLPQKDTSQKTVTTVLKLTLKGTYAQISRFIEGLESSQQLILIKQLTLLSPQGLVNTTTANVAIKTFFSLE